MMGHDVFVQVDQQHVRIFVHGAVQAVVQRCEQAFCADFFLGHHVQLPGQQGHHAFLHVVLQNAINLVADRVVVKREVLHAQYPVQFDKFQYLKRLKWESLP